jgi:hypothetical protein
MIKRIKNWFRKRKQWHNTGANYVSDIEEMKKALRDPNIIYLKGRGGSKTTATNAVLNDLVSEFETKTGTKVEDWQKEIAFGIYDPKNRKAFYRNLRTGQIVHEVSETDIVNMHINTETKKKK